MKRRLPKSKRAWLSIALLLAGLLAFSFRTEIAAFLHGFGWTDIRDGVIASGPWAPVICILLYAATTILFLPTTLVGILVALLYGPWIGLPVCVAGLGLGMSGSFLIARHLAREALERRIGDTKLYRRLEENIQQEGWKLVLFSRLLPINPFSFLNYAYGLTRISFARYLLASLVGILPNTLALLWTTHAAGQLATGRMDWRILIALFAGAGLFAGLAWLPRFLRRKKPDTLPLPDDDVLPDEN